VAEEEEPVVEAVRAVPAVEAAAPAAEAEMLRLPLRRRIPGSNVSSVQRRRNFRPLHYSVDTTARYGRGFQ